MNINISKLTYFNPFSNRHHAYQDSKRLPLKQQIICWLAAVVIGGITLGLGALPIFRYSVGRFSKNLSSKNKKPASSTHQLAVKKLCSSPLAPHVHAQAPATHSNVSLAPLMQPKSTPPHPHAQSPQPLQSPVSVLNIEGSSGAKNGERPFFSGRRGFPNQSFANCPKNSLGIVVAHGDFLNGNALNCTKPNETIEQFESRAEKEKQKLKKENERELKNLKQKLEDKIKNSDLEIEEYKNELAEKEEKWQFYNDKVTGMQRVIEGKLNHDYANIKQLFYVMKKSKEIFWETNLEIDKIKKNIEELEKIKKNIEKEIKKEEDVIKNRIKELDSELKKEKEILERSWIKYHEYKTAREVISILQTGKGRALTMEDAQILAGVSSHFNVEGQGYMPYKGSQEAKDDVNHDRLRQALDDPNWRVIRVGGHGHWWTYVRNRGSNTVDEINDTTIYPNRMTFDEILRRWSKPREWLNSQITFY